MTKRTARTGLSPARPLERGINLDVRGAALIAQANDRISWHRRTAAVMTTELKAIPGADAENSTENWTREQRRTELSRSIARHEEYARFLDFVRQHLVRGQVYRLSLADLLMLEISPKGSYL